MSREPGRVHLDLARGCDRKRIAQPPTRRCTVASKMSVPWRTPTGGCPRRGALAPPGGDRGTLRRCGDDNRARCAWGSKVSGEPNQTSEPL